MINNTDLYNNQYSEKELIENIDNLSVYTILTKQKNLSKEFINNYILNPKYHFSEKEKDITIVHLQLYQPEYYKQLFQKN